MVDLEKITLSSTLATMTMIDPYLGPTLNRIPYIYPYYWHSVVGRQEQENILVSQEKITFSSTRLIHILGLL